MSQSSILPITPHGLSFQLREPEGYQINTNNANKLCYTSVSDCFMS